MIGRIVSIVVGLGLIVGAAVLYTEPFTPALAPSAVPNFTRSEAPPLAGDDDPRLARQPGETDLAYASRLNGEVSRAFAHCTPVESIAHSWLLHALHAAGFTYITEQGMLTSRRNLCGFCHQAAHIEAAILRRNGVAAEAFGLTGHVVVRATIDGGTYYLDPDYGLGPFREIDPDFAARLVAAYAPFSDQVAALAPSYYLTRDDNLPYYTDGYLETVARQQDVLLVIQDLLLALAVVLGAVCLWRGARPAGWRRASEGSPAPLAQSPESVAGSLPTRASA